VLEKIQKSQIEILELKNAIIKVKNLGWLSSSSGRAPA
jgi:hypothetical protein